MLKKERIDCWINLKTREKKSKSPLDDGPVQFMGKKNIYKRFNKIAIKFTLQIKKIKVRLADIATSVGEKLADVKFTYPVDLVFQSLEKILWQSGPVESKNSPAVN